MLNSPTPTRETKTPVAQRADVARCVITGATGDDASLLRLALDPSGILFADLSLSELGDGVFVCARRDVVAEAAQRAVSGALFDGVRAGLGEDATPAAFADDVAERISQRLLNTLGLVRKAGELFAGHTLVLKAFEQGRLGVVINSADAADNGCEKIISRARRQKVFCVRAFSSGALGAAIGRGDTMHIAVKAGVSAMRIRNELLLLNAFGRASIDVGLNPA